MSPKCINPCGITRELRHTHTEERGLEPLEEEEEEAVHLSDDLFECNSITTSKINKKKYILHVYIGWKYKYIRLNLENSWNSIFYPEILY